jgi:perosamine synthetase
MNTVLDKQAISQPLAINGGPKAMPQDYDWSHLNWPIITDEDEQAVLEVLRSRSMSATDITKLFEAEFAQWIGAEYALACCNGTAALLEAMWACGVGAGDEIICPSVTYWASAAPALQLGAAVNFADISPKSLCIDPNDIEHRIGPRTKAIVVVHYCGHPCDMDPIMDIARRHNVKVIEDVSHAHGALYKGRKCGTIGDIAAMSLMTGKGFAIGEGGMLVTNNRSLYEHAIAYGHYERTGAASRFNPADKQITDDGLSRFCGLPIGGVKHRLIQTASAMGRVQLKHFDARMREIQAAMNTFWDLLEGVPGIRAHRPADKGTTMGCWYYARGLFAQSELDEIDCAKFCEAVSAEGYKMLPGANKPLHLHPVFQEADIFRQGKPTMVAFGQRDVRQGPGSLPVAESINNIAFDVPWFKHNNPAAIVPVATALAKVAMHFARQARKAGTHKGTLPVAGVVTRDSASR